MPSAVIVTVLAVSSPVIVNTPLSNDMVTLGTVRSAKLSSRGMNANCLPHVRG